MSPSGFGESLNPPHTLARRVVMTFFRAAKATITTTPPTTGMWWWLGRPDQCLNKEGAPYGCGLEVEKVLVVVAKPNPRLVLASIPLRVFFAHISYHLSKHFQLKANVMKVAVQALRCTECQS